MNMRKIIALLMALMLIVSLIGCGENDKSDVSSSATDDSSEQISDESYDDGVLRMPDVIGMEQDEAKAVLKALGQTARLSLEYSSEVEKGCVIRSDYEVGEELVKNGHVILYISDGEGSGYDPDVLYVDPLVEARGELPQGANSDYVPLNYETMKCVWLSQFDMNGVYCAGIQRDKDDFTARIRQVFENVARDGFNTVIVQLRPNGDSFYPSKYYPWSKYVVGAYGTYGIYDPLEIMIEEAHKLQLSFQAWINPMRGCESSTSIEIFNVSYPLRQWNDDPSKNKYFMEYSQRYYLNPAYEEVRQLIIDGVVELVRYYDVDGIHMDDYFYPSGIPSSFDQEAFDQSGLSSRLTFRQNNLKALVSGMYSAIKAENPNVLYGISPAGNLYNVRYKDCLDIDYILSHEGFVDYIMPQLYWGFEHPTAPFGPLFDEWCSLIKVDSIKMVTGVSLGRAAGESTDEWRNNKDVFKRYVEYMQDSGMFSGFSVYCYSYMYIVSTGQPNAGVAEEMSNFLPLIQKIENVKVQYS